MLYLIQGGLFKPDSKGYNPNYYLLSFYNNAKTNKGYIIKQPNGKFKLYFKWDPPVKDKRVQKGKNYKFFNHFQSVINFLLSIKFSCEVSVANWNGNKIEVVNPIYH